jgi:glycosyltransferase involved in cell wall biosynthesis
MMIEILGVIFVGFSPSGAAAGTRRDRQPILNEPSRTYRFSGLQNVIVGRASDRWGEALVKILLVNDYGTPHGGAEIATILLRDGLRLRGHEAMLLTSAARPVAVPSDADAECFGTTSRWRTLLQTANLSARRALGRTLRAFRPDIVHVGMFLTQLSPLILPLLRGIPSVYHVHWLRPICPTGAKMLPDGSPCRSPAGLACYRSGCLPLRDWLPLMGQMSLWWRWRSSFAAIVANSEATRQSLAAAGLEKVAVIPCGVAPRRQRPPLSGPPAALFSGRLVRQKGIDVLLQAWSEVARQLPEARLKITGDGPERERLEQTLPPGVALLGHLAPASFDEVAEDAWVQVVPSLGQEAFGLAAAEAMMRGTAVLASRTGGLPEVVEAEASGRLVAPGDPGELAAALIAMLGDRELCESMGAAGRAIGIRQFSADVYVERFIALYRALLMERRHDRAQ